MHEALITERGGQVCGVQPRSPSAEVVILLSSTILIYH